MTALVSSNSTFFLNPSNNSSHTAGILLNSHSQSSPSHPREPRQQSFTSSSSSASHTSHSQSPSSNEGEGSSRKIRFAPLPAPRRDESSTVFYESDSDIQLDATPSQYPQLPPSPRTPSISTLQPDDTPSKSKSRTWGQKLLRPLLYPLLPSTTTNGEESYSTLFRISSRDSTKATIAPPSDSYRGGEPLARRRSTGSRAISSTKEVDRSHLYRDGVPLSPVMSEGFAAKGRKDGQRMLNGRVYGRRYPPSQNGDQTSYEPEFVEWGYGGMGSVSNNQAKSRFGPDWAKLQSKGKVLGGGSDADEQDDGSGMGWVKRRREKREREERERALREKAIPDGDARHAVPDIAVYSPQHENSENSRPSLSRDDPNQPRDSGEHHVYRAVNVPAPHHHHVRHHSQKAGDGSGSATPTSAPPLSRANSSNSVPIFSTASSGSHGEILPTMSERKEEAEISSESSEAGSISIDEEDDDEDEIFTERESDEDDRDDAEGRITSRCAGVEKISRHKA